MNYQYRLDVVLKVMLLLLCGSPVYGAEKTEMKSYQFHEEFEVTPQSWFAIEDGLKMQFVSHSHKRQVANGPGSPLIVTMKYELLGKKFEEQHNLYPDSTSPAHWVWNNYRIQLIKYTYGESMILTIGKLDP